MFISEGASEFFHSSNGASIFSINLADKEAFNFIFFAHITEFVHMVHSVAFTCV